MAAPYAKRRIRLTFRLGKGSFGQSGFNSVVVSADVKRANALRIQAIIENGGMPNPFSAIILVYGMPLSQISQLTEASFNWKESPNSVMVEAGDDTGMTTVFNGQFFKVTPRFNNGPNTAMEVLANAGYKIQMEPVSPTSMQGGVSIDVILERVLKPTGYKLENLGVRATLSNPYLFGTSMEQIMAVIRAAGCLGALDTANGVLRIWPTGGYSPSGDPPLISPATGMIGYPEFDYNTITVRSMFDPTLRGPKTSAEVGRLFKLESQIDAANGLWQIQQIDYFLVSEAPDAPWEMTIKAIRDPADWAKKVQNSGAVTTNAPPVGAPTGINPFTG